MSFNVPSKVAERLQTGIKKFQTILASAKSRDCNESDTSTIVSDMLAEIFGYDKYSEITSELAIRGTYCDLAIKLDGKLVLLLEVKAIGLELKEAHTKQAIDYAANQGVEWVILTNGIHWHIYHIIFGQPIEQELVYNFNFLDLNHKTDDDVESIYLLTKEGQSKFALEDFHSQRQVMNRFFISAILDSEAVLSVLR
ncbi:MAG: type I restriction enzyme HsdR N-terminal domain-containing protein, partial [Pseudomonadota bacterium]